MQRYIAGVWEGAPGVCQDPGLGIRRGFIAMDFYFHGRNPSSWTEVLAIGVGGPESRARCYHPWEPGSRLGEEVSPQCLGLRIQDSGTLALSRPDKETENLESRIVWDRPRR